MSDKPKGPKDVSTCRELIEIMPQGLNPENTEGLNAVIQFDISGDEEFTAHLVIVDGQAEAFDGPAEDPTLTIISPADVWLGITRGEINPQMAFVRGHFKSKGDMGLLLKMNSLFKS